MTKGYEFHPKAEDDFTGIWDFIAADSPDAADRVTGEIVSKIDGLVKFPYQGHSRSDLTSRPIALCPYLRLLNRLCARFCGVGKTSRKRFFLGMNPLPNLLLPLTR